MKIVKIGGFNETGCPTGWHFDLEYAGSAVQQYKAESLPYCLGIDILFPGAVDVGGIEMVEWTQKRKDAIEQKMTVMI